MQLSGTLSVLAWLRRGPGEPTGHESVGELGRDGLPGDQDPVVNGADELVDRCLPVLRLLEPNLASGTLVAAGDIDHTGVAGYLDYVSVRK